MESDGEVIQRQHFCHHGDTICHPTSGYVTTKLHRTSICGCNNNAILSGRAEYCSQVWCRSAHTHRLAAALDNGLRLVSGCIRSTPTFMLPVVSGIMPPDIRRNKQCLALSRRAEADDQHALHNIVTASTPGRKRLQSRHPFSEHAKQLTRELRRSRKDQQDVGRSDLGNEMGHHTLPIKNVHPNSLKQTHMTWSSTILAGTVAISIVWVWRYRPDRTTHCQRVSAAPL